MKNKSVYFKKWQSPVGELFLYSDDKNLLALTFSVNNKEVLMRLDSETLVNKPSRVIEEAIKQLQEYFAGSRKSFAVPNNPLGTEFQKKAWAQLTKIKFGETMTYQDQAKMIKSEKAVRAIGTANGKNPIAIIIPCHRVIRSNGKLSGYSGGSEIKEKLLKIECVQTI
jgi:methylated-DNA-[protein]-cysteine S-methyltransferase